MSSPSPHRSNTMPVSIMSPTPGTRTPRRVQWANTDHVHEPEPVSPHALDEMAQDPIAFETLKDALERHQPSRTHSGSPSHVMTPTLEVHTYPPSTPPSSVPTSPTSSTPFLPRRTHFAWPSLHRPPGKHRHGHIEHFAVREAAGVVRAHMKRWGILGRRHRSKSRSRSRVPDPEPDSKKEDRNEEEENHHPTPEQPPKKSWWHFHTPSSVAPTPHHPPPYAQMRALRISSCAGCFSAETRHTAKTNLDGKVEEDHEEEVASKAAIQPQGDSEVDLEDEVIDVEEDQEEDSQDTLAPPTTATATTSTSTPTSTPSESTPPINLPPTSTPTSAQKPNSRSKRWKGVLKDLPLPASGASTPGTSGTGTRASSVAGSPDKKERDGGGGKERGDGDYFCAKWMEEQKDRDGMERKEREKERRRKRKRAEVYVRFFPPSFLPSSTPHSHRTSPQITRHVAAILQRQEFILKLARAMMMFGGPSHRLVAQIQSTARISFEDNATGTSSVKFIRQGSTLDLGKLGEAHGLYWDSELMNGMYTAQVIHNVISVSSASAALDTLMRKKPIYSFPQLISLGGMCSSSICSVSFNGSFLDCLVSFPLGALLVTI
ncbi:hypothetical protein EDB19DRAFT_1906997 [Suillus lakei]|nr:hypothetical protein EDB19DRAFT_1906997 [Suillus lakei]